MKSSYPLGGISNSLHIGCNENGYWQKYKSDKYGFNNNNVNYEKEIDVLIIGDSFAEGACVKNEFSISNILNNKFNLNTITLGKGSNGPLVEYALLREYIDIIKPKTVIWLYYENDINNLIKEYDIGILKKYLKDKNFSQSLYKKQDAIDKILKEYLKKNLNNLPKKNKLKAFLKLEETRKKINLNPTPKNQQKIDKKYFEILKDIMIKSNNLVLKKNSEFYFVYIPWYYQYKRIYKLHK